LAFEENWGPLDEQQDLTAELRMFYNEYCENTALKKKTTRDNKMKLHFENFFKSIFFKY